MELVTAESLETFLQKYRKARGGELNEFTDSEAMFVAIKIHGGAYQLHTGLGIFWVGIQNASSRWSQQGLKFISVRRALEAVLDDGAVQLYYSEDSVERLRWLAERLAEYKAMDQTICVGGA